MDKPGSRALLLQRPLDEAGALLFAQLTTVAADSDDVAWRSRRSGMAVATTRPANKMPNETPTGSRNASCKSEREVMVE